MAPELIYASRLMRLPLLDAGGVTIGQIADVVLVPPYRSWPPRVVGFVAAVQRRRIFLPVARVEEVDRAGARLKGSAIDVRHFELRPGEVLAGDLLDRTLGNERVSDIALTPAVRRRPGWEVSAVALTSRSGLRRRSPRLVPWREAASLWDTGDVPEELADYREMHPSDVARAVTRLPLERRRKLAAAMEDQRLADVLEELEEDEQLRLIEGLDTTRIAHLLEEMDPDDAVDLLAEMPSERQRVLLEAMPTDEAAPLRRLLRYGEHTAGGLMTPEPVIVAPRVSVAEALARLREHELSPALAAQAFVCQSPTDTPTGRHLGTVGFQRLLREPPATEVRQCVEEDRPVIKPTAPEAEVAAILAAYNLLAVAVCDENGRLLGAVSADDVLDAILPEGWRAAVLP